VPGIERLNRRGCAAAASQSFDQCFAMGLDLHNSLIILKGVLTARLSQPDSARYVPEYIPGGHGREGGG
jgi:hypothetical protein